MSNNFGRRISCEIQSDTATRLYTSWRWKAWKECDSGVLGVLLGANEWPKTTEIWGELIKIYEKRRDVRILDISKYPPLSKSETQQRVRRGFYVDISRKNKSCRKGKRWRWRTKPGLKGLKCPGEHELGQALGALSLENHQETFIWEQGCLCAPRGERWREKVGQMVPGATRRLGRKRSLEACELKACQGQKRRNRTSCWREQSVLIQHKSPEIHDVPAGWIHQSCVLPAKEEVLMKDRKRCPWKNTRNNGLKNIKYSKMAWRTSFRWGRGRRGVCRVDQHLLHEWQASNGCSSETNICVRGRERTQLRGKQLFLLGRLPHRTYLPSDAFDNSAITCSTIDL